MERLTEKLDKMIWFKDQGLKIEPCEMNTHHCRMILEKLADYEEAEEQGLLMKLPVPLGTTVYTLSTIFDCIYDYDCKSYQKWKCEEDIPCEYEKRSYHIKETDFGFVMAHSIGETVFLTREEAEKKLEEMQNDKT